MNSSEAWGKTFFNWRKSNIQAVCQTTSCMSVNVCIVMLRIKYQAVFSIKYQTSGHRQVSSSIPSLFYTAAAEATCFQQRLKLFFRLDPTHWANFGLPDSKCWVFKSMWVLIKLQIMIIFLWYFLFFCDNFSPSSCDRIMTLTVLIFFFDGSQKQFIWQPCCQYFVAIEQNGLDWKKLEDGCLTWEDLDVKIACLLGKNDYFRYSKGVTCCSLS